ncbi:hypothetical protein OBV_05570 [Oscillibacter valericigenes Sjm18-20]|nr:hypothetical protein OBV_05570 [Oscillibacter valericigenes Sjm18-20]
MLKSDHHGRYPPLPTGALKSAPVLLSYAEKPQAVRREGLCQNWKNFFKTLMFFKKRTIYGIQG